MIRSDIFMDKKGVHVKLDKEVHAALRGLTFKYNLSMQEIFEEFAKAFVSEDHRAIKIVEEFVKQKIQAKLDGLSRRKRKNSRISELDQDTLYNMINEKEDKLNEVA